MFGQAAVSESFMEAYSQERLASARGTEGVDTLAEDFFRLGYVLDWVQNERENIGERTLQIHRALQDTLEEWRAQYEIDPQSLECLLRPFEEDRPATFVHTHLIHLLVRELRGYRLTQNDSLDFCHAVIAAAYGGLATLDGAWKRRIESLPAPSRLARIYYGPELGELVTMLESVETS